MKILKLEAENVKRLKSVVVRPDPNDPVVVIRGNNAQGKSSLLDAIRFAFAGKGVQPPRVVREGQTEAHVEIETDEITVLRRWTGHAHEDGPSTEVEVRAKNGAKLKSPQAVLNHLYANLAFDPLEFMRLPAAEQALQVKKIVGVDTEAIDLEHAAVYEKRTITNRDLHSAQARLKALPTEAPPPRPDLSKLLTEQQTIATKRAAAGEVKNARAAAARRVEDARGHITTAERAVAQLKKQLAESEESLSLARAGLEQRQKEYAAADNAVDELEDDSAHVEALARIRKAIEEASAIAVANDRWDAREQLAAEVKSFEALEKAQTKAIDKLTADKSKLLQGASFPVPGLSFTASGVKFNDLPLEQASSAEQLRVSVAMGMAANPKLRVMLSREGSLLDDHSMSLLRELCREKDFQLWIEVVGENGPAAVVISDGEVAKRAPHLKAVPTDGDL